LVQKSKFKESREEVCLVGICRTYIFCHLYRLGTCGKSGYLESLATSCFKKASFQGVQRGDKFVAFLLKLPVLPCVQARKLGIAGHSLFQKSKFKESREEVILGAIYRTYIFCHLYRLET
jgi:hypothetical protein